MAIRPQKAFFWFLDELRDKLKIWCEHLQRQQCIGSIRGRIHQFVKSIRPPIRLRCEWPLKVSGDDIFNIFQNLSQKLQKFSIFTMNDSKSWEIRK